MKKYLLLSLIIGIFLGLLPYFLFPRVKVQYNNTLELICKVYNETDKVSMACNPIDIEKSKKGELVTFGFELPSNTSFNISRTIHCLYDLNNKRFTYCYQLNIGVEELGK